MDQQGISLQPLATPGAVTSFYAYEGGAARNAVLAARVAAGYHTKKWAERAQAHRTAEEAHMADRALTDAGVVDTYAGTANIPPDGQMMGDALPPAIPVDGNGRSNAIH